MSAEDELYKYKELIKLTVKYYKEQGVFEGVETDETFAGIIEKSEQLYEKKRLASIKRLFDQITEMLVQIHDFKFNLYLQKNSSYEIDIFDRYKAKIQKIIKRGKIKNDDEYRLLSEFIDYQEEDGSIDKVNIDLISNILSEYHKNEG